MLGETPLHYACEKFSWRFITESNKHNNIALQLIEKDSSSINVKDNVCEIVHSIKKNLSSFC